ncbi:MAG: hypothetical protein J2P30_00425 [Actinobacteria bacterium]|nr:hypothetical protein [Actinomycetota bacterium]
MSGANYMWCPVCGTKALYVGEEDIPEGIVIAHGACLDKAVDAATTAERDRIAALAESVRAVATADEGTQCWFADLIREQT